MTPVEVDVDRLSRLLLVVLRPVEVDVDRLCRLLLVVLRPVEVEVDRLSRLLLVVLRPVEVDVDRLSKLLFVVLKPVDRLLIPLAKPPTLVDSEVAVVESCATLTASVSAAPGATPVITRSPTFNSPEAVAAPSA